MTEEHSLPYGKDMTETMFGEIYNLIIVLCHECNALSTQLENPRHNTTQIIKRSETMYHSNQRNIR